MFPPHISKALLSRNSTWNSLLVFVSSVESVMYTVFTNGYGLRQASRAWNDTFNNFLSVFGLIASQADPCVYLYQSGNDFLIDALWVNGGLLICNNSALLARILSYLKTTFVITPKAADRFVLFFISHEIVSIENCIYHNLVTGTSRVFFLLSE